LKHTLLYHRLGKLVSLVTRSNTNLTTSGHCVTTSGHFVKPFCLFNDWHLHRTFALTFWFFFIICTLLNTFLDTFILTYFYQNCSIQIQTIRPIRFGENYRHTISRW